MISTPRGQNTESYRPEIDGLRAIAVLLTIGFHAFPEVVPGGFIGVDIFFVISGFLISRILFDGIDLQTFRFLDFYVRRIRRIFPALLVVVTACLGFGWFALLAEEYKQLGQHAVAAALFLSNFVLWQETGYFDRASDLKPLLHLWSLGLEEQFYAVWPLVATMVGRLRVNRFLVVLFLVLVSFGFNLKYAGDGTADAFFLPVPRFWEPLCGALLAAWRPRTQGHGASATFCGELMPFLGAAAIIVAVTILNRDVPYPGWGALLPVGGATLIIAGSPKSWLNRHVMANQILVGIGLISYPLYLWHWPMLSFAHILETRVSTDLACVLIAASFGLSYLTYRLVEMPIRRPSSGLTKPLVLSLLMAVLAVVGYLIYCTNGVPSRASVDDTVFSWDAFHSPGCIEDMGVKPSFCMKYGPQDNIRVALLGDSTANSLAPGLGDWYSKRGIGLVNIGSYTCAPIRGLLRPDWWGDRDDCINTNNWSYNYVLTSPSIDTVILSLFSRDIDYWEVPGFRAQSNIHGKFKVIKKLLSDDIADLQRHGKKVIITYDMPYAPFDPHSCIKRPFSLGHRYCSIDEAALRLRHPYVDLFNEMFAERKDICVFRQSELFLHADKFHFLDGDGRFLMRDDHHLSKLGSTQMAELMMSKQCAQRASN